MGTLSLAVHAALRTNKGTVPIKGLVAAIDLAAIDLTDDNVDVHHSRQIVGANVGDVILEEGLAAPLLIIKNHSTNPATILNGTGAGSVAISIIPAGGIAILRVGTTQTYVQATTVALDLEIIGIGNK